MVKPTSNYLENKLYARTLFEGSSLFADLLSIENFILRPPTTAATRSEFKALKKSHRTHYRQLLKELKMQYK